MTAISQPLAALVHAWKAEPAQRVPEHLRDEARRKLLGLRAQATPATADEWRSFLAPLNAAVRNPQSPDALRAFATVCATALANIPAALLTREAQVATVRAFAFWPAVAELDEHFREDAHRIHGDLAALRRIADAPVALTAPAEQPLDRGAASAKLTALAAELRGDDQPRPTPRAAYLQPHQLARAYRQQAERAADEASAERLYQRAERLDAR